MLKDDQASRLKKLEKLQSENHTLKEKVAALKKENDELKKRNSLLNALPAGVVLIQQEKIIDINEAASRTIGFTVEEIIGRPFLDFVHPNSVEFAKNLDKKRISGKWVSQQYEMDLVARDGQTVYCDVRVNKIQFNGRNAFLLNLTKIDEKKIREKKIIQSKKSEALVTMALGLNRQLRPSLTSITKNIATLRPLTDFTKTDMIAYLDSLESAANTALSTMQKLIKIIGDKDDQTGMVPFDLKKVVKRAVTLTGPGRKDEAGKKDNIILKTYLRSVSPVKGNPEEIQTVIINMILNAVEALPKGGDIYLTTEENAGYAHIYIQDNGLGIPDEIRDRIFDPFFTTKGNDRMGLGLTLSQAIIKRHKGEIEVLSGKDQGTTFAIRLPLAKSKKRSQALSMKKKIKNANLLTIDDESILGELLSQLLLSKGFRVAKAASGLEALNMLKRKGFDLVIAGTQSPDMNGAILVKKIRQIDRGLPVILIAEYESENQFQNLEKSGADLLITKPIDMNRLVNQISEVLAMKADARGART